VSAASVVAKVTRDRLMIELSQQYPGYGFERHKGYGTRIHWEALQKLGPCLVHRMSYRPIQLLADC
jgi:ribonuclease HII